MKGNQALDALVALCDVERVEGKCDNSTGERQESIRWATPQQVPVDGTDRPVSSSHTNVTATGQNTSALPSHTNNVGNNVLPYIQFLQSQMLNAQQMNSKLNINNLPPQGGHSYQNPLNSLFMNVQQVPQPSDIASLNAGVYTQLIKSQPFLSLNPYTALPQHEMIKTSENISCATTSIDAPSIKKGVGHFASSTSDKKHRLSEEEEDSDSHSNVMSTEEKRCNKRAANRLSAQLSRRRRKVFMEELKEENEKLRRKESILNSIPDLVVVFDSAGKIGFVSKSVCTMLKFTADELHGSSFWDRLSDDSERLVKAAFMDSLAAKCESSETVPLGQGIWEIQIIDKDLSLKHVTLHGVVHFLGENPQCVCTIRPQDHSSTLNTVYTADTNKNGLVKKISSISSSSKESSRKDGGSVDMVTLSGETGEVIESVMSKEIRSSRILSSGTVQISDIESVID